MEHRQKRVKLSDDGAVGSSTSSGRASRRSISPPQKRKAPVAEASTASRASASEPPPSADLVSTLKPRSRLIPSPVQLNNIVELPASSNLDTVSLRDILGDPLISECWLFNYLFDVDFLM